MTVWLTCCLVTPIKGLYEEHVTATLLIKTCSTARGQGKKSHKKQRKALNVAKSWSWMSEIPYCCHMYSYTHTHTLGTTHSAWMRTRCCYSRNHFLFIPWKPPKTPKDVNTNFPWQLPLISLGGIYAPFYTCLICWREDPHKATSNMRNGVFTRLKMAENL